MDEYLHVSLERFTRMQDQIIELKTVRLKDAKEMLEMCMSAIYQMALKISFIPVDTKTITTEAAARDWVHGFVRAQAGTWSIKWEVNNNSIKIIELMPVNKNPRQ